MSQFMTKAALDVLKYYKYKIGCVDRDKMRDMLRLDKYICSDYCFIDDEASRSIRESVIIGAINKLDEL